MTEFEPRPGPELQPGSIEQTLAGRADLRIGAVLREAWEKTDGIKAPVLAGVALVYGVLSIVLYLLGFIFESSPEDPDLLGEAVVQLVVTVIFYPFMAGAFMFGLRRSLGQPVRFEDLFSQYGRALPIVVVALLQSFATGIGFLLLIVPGLYLSIALSLAVPLKVERDLAPIECLATSLRLVNRKFLEVLALSLLGGLLMALGILSLIGWIWTIPWVMLIFSITYRQLAGVAGGVAPGSAQPGSGGIVA
jgi:hypothetical protein